MNAPPALDTTALDAALAGVASVAGHLEPPAPHERRSVMREEAALLLDGLLVRVARGRGAVDVALGEVLAALSVGDRLLRLGFSGLGDYARERLGLAASTAEKLARLARALGERPLLRDAVRSGLVTARKAEAVLPVARGDAEAAWVARARVETVRALQAAVKAAAGERSEEDEEPWTRVALPLPPADRARLDEALALAGTLLGATAPRWQRVEAICQEYLSAHAPTAEAEEDGGDAPLLDHALTGPQVEELRAWLESETARWCFLEVVGPLPSPLLAEPPGGEDGLATLDLLTRLDARLRQLAALRASWDERLGQLALLLRQLGLWRDLQFLDFGHYCTERLGLSPRAVAQRATLERRFHELPPLREALREGRLGYEKVRLLARCAGEQSVAAWVRRAEGLTCVALAREIEAGEDEQMCARGELRLRIPVRVAGLLDAALRAAQRDVARLEGRRITPGEALVRVAEHFIETWKPLLAGRNTLAKRVLARDRGHCQVPGCSRAALQVHHVVFRSRGGADVPENLVGLCAGHHLHGIHRGFVRLRGRAPDRLRWEVPALAVALPC